MKNNNSELSEFLKKSFISMEDWEKSGLEWSLLQEIGEDFASKQSSLNSVAEFLAKTLQACPEVHSVRWRVKDVSHLLAKLVRKRISGVKKYTNVSVENYTDTVTDLVGIRILHLFKSDWEQIDAFIHSKWSMYEPTIAYIRAGDNQRDYEEKIGDIKEHPAGYRSIHYLVEFAATKEKVISEIQVRTLFEEGWSEIDHLVRYPNYSENALLAYFLNIFNRMSGSADEMGSFVNNLTDHIKQTDDLILQANEQRDGHINKIESLLKELEAEKNISGEFQEKLSNELQSLKPNLSQLQGFSFLNIAGSLHEEVLKQQKNTHDLIQQATKPFTYDPAIMASELRALYPGDIIGSAFSSSKLGSSISSLAQPVNNETKK